VLWLECECIPVRHTALREIGLRHRIGLTDDDGNWYKADVNIRIYTEFIMVIQIRKNVCLVYSRPDVPALDPHARSDSGRDANTHAARYNIDHILIRCQKLVPNTPVRHDIRQPEDAIGSAFSWLECRLKLWSGYIATVSGLLPASALADDLDPISNLRPVGAAAGKWLTPLTWSLSLVGDGMRDGSS